MTTKAPTSTPWGKPDYPYPEQIADGIYWYSTPSHGGYWLSPERREQMPPALRAIRPFGGREGWYEEDCDWAIVALSFPEHFNEHAREAARDTAKAPWVSWHKAGMRFLASQQQEAAS